MMKTAISNSGSVSTPRFAPYGLVACLYFLISATGNAQAQSPSEPAKAAIQSVTVAVSPLALKTPEGERNVLVVSVESVGLSNATLRLASGVWPEPQTKTIAELASGSQTLDFPVPLLNAATPVTVRIETPAEQRDFGPFTLQPPRRWTVYLA